MHRVASNYQRVRGSSHLSLCVRIKTKSNFQFPSADNADDKQIDTDLNGGGTE
jgi:hypothetical protein